MTITFIHGDIINKNADGLVCSGNIYLNMSGGVNGALLSGGGEELQRQLHRYLHENNLRFVPPGFVMEIGPGHFHFKSIVYSVAINGWYESSVELAKQTLINALTILEQKHCKTVNIPALATGYGQLKKTDFGNALHLALTSKQWTFDEIRMIERNKYGLEDIRRGFYESSQRQ